MAAWLAAPVPPLPPVLPPTAKEHRTTEVEPAPEPDAAATDGDAPTSKSKGRLKGLVKGDSSPKDKKPATEKQPATGVGVD